MNRRGFLGMLGKLVAVGAAMGVSPALIAPAEKKISEWTYEWVQVGGPPIGEVGVDGEVYAFELKITGEGEPQQWMLDMEKCKLFIESQAPKTTLAS